MAELDDNLDEVNNQLRTLKETLGNAVTPAFERVVEQLVKDKKISQDMAAEKVKEYRQLQKDIAAKENSTKRLEQFNTMLVSGIPGFVDMSRAANAVSGQLYNAKDAFTSVIPAIDMTASTFKKAAEALGTALSNISVLGASMGKAPEGLAKFVNTAVDFAVDIAKSQLQYAQNIANSFRDLGASGMQFGGSVTAMTNAAAASGQTLNRFAEFVTKNNSVLSMLSGNMVQNASDLLLMSKNIGQTNRALLVSYGSYEALNDGIAQYVGLQQQLGFVDMNNQKAMTVGATEYLVRQRELTAITGKRAEQLVAEEKRRRGELDYALKLSTLSTAQQKNVEATMQIAGRISPAAEAYIKEYFATGGNVVSKQALTFEAMQGAVAQTLVDTLSGATTMDAQAFKDNTSKVLEANAPALEAFARSMQELASINRAAMNPILTEMTTTASGILQNMNLFKNASELFKTLVPPKEGDAKTEEVGKAIDKMVENQRKLDDMASKSITRMSELTDIGFKMQERILGLSDATADMLSALTKGEGAAALTKIAERLLNMEAPDPGSSIPNPPRTGRGQPPMRTNAYGGVVDEPSIAGEDGPEAIIPLAKGNVPLDIDWTPMVRALYELIDKVQEGNDINDRILKASY